MHLMFPCEPNDFCNIPDRNPLCQQVYKPDFLFADSFDGGISGSLTGNRNKGYIDVRGTEGKGTTFILYFPVTREEIAEREEALPAEAYGGKGESILVVDDVEEQREIASGMLKKLGYAVTSVSSGEEAVDYLKNDSVDLIVLDMIMDPGIDGLETYKRILKLHPGQKAIIASGFSETEQVKEAQRLGAGRYIKKPYTLEKIGIAIREELKNDNSNRERK